MIDESAITTLPKVPFREVEDAAEGLRVFEILLKPAGTVVAPFNASRFTVAPNYTSPVDSHAVREIWIVAEGSGELVYDDRTTRISASDVVYFEPPKAHYVRNDGSTSLVIFSIWWSAQSTDHSSEIA